MANLSPTTNFLASIGHSDALSQAKAESLADKFSCPIATVGSSSPQLLVQDNKISLHVADLGNPITIDFCSGKYDHRRKFGGGKGQPLAKAIGIKAGHIPSVIDATAGFARDAFVLATLGCDVLMLERHPILSILIQDAIEHAFLNEQVAAIAHHMQIINCNAQDYLEQLNSDACPDVIYMDPMYPSRDKSALVKKEMQLLHQMIGPDTDSGALLLSARNKAKKRVVVKRPKGAEYVAGAKPSVSIESKNTRYDVYVTL